MGFELRTQNSKFAHILQKKRTPSPRESSIRVQTTLRIYTRKRHKKYLKYEVVESGKTTTEKVCDTRVDVSRERRNDRRRQKKKTRKEEEIHQCRSIFSQHCIYFYYLSSTRFGRVLLGMARERSSRRSRL